MTNLCATSSSRKRGKTYLWVLRGASPCLEVSGSCELGRYFAKPLHPMDDPYGWQVLQAHQLEDFLGVCRREGFDAKVGRGVQGQVGLA